MTDLLDIFKESLPYPIHDIKFLLIFGVFFVIMQLSNILFGWGAEIGTGIHALLGILSLLASIFVCGYFIAVLRETISGQDALPEIDFANNFVDGIKYIIVAILYMIIPFIISLVIAAATGVFNNIFGIMTFISENQGLMQNATSVGQAIPPELLSGLLGGLAITGVISIILFIIFSLLLLVAAARMAETGSMSEALMINKVVEDIKTIGFGRIIGWYVIYIIISIIFAIIIAIISAIPYIGVIITALVCSPFIYLFEARALGLLYAEK